MYRTSALRPACRSRRAPRRGAVLVLVLVVLGIALALCGAVLRVAIVERGVVERQIWQAQADTLAQAALDRAAARLDADPAYTGETWTAAATTLGGRHDGQVEISITSAADSPGNRQVEVRAAYPSNLELPARATRRVPLSPATEGD